MANATRSVDPDADVETRLIEARLDRLEEKLDQLLRRLTIAGCLLSRSGDEVGQ